MDHTYRIGEAVICGEWLHYTNPENGNLTWERNTRNWKGRTYQVCKFLAQERICNWLLNKWSM